MGLLDTPNKISTGQPKNLGKIPQDRLKGMAPKSSKVLLSNPSGLVLIKRRSAFLDQCSVCIRSLCFSFSFIFFQLIKGRMAISLGVMANFNPTVRSTM